MTRYYDRMSLAEAIRADALRSGVASPLTRYRDRAGLAVGIWTVTALLLGLALRLPLVWGHSFPIWDGGLFYTMAQNLEANHGIPPLVTTYNNAHIPFAYPPLGIYLLAALHQLGVSFITTLIWLPFLVNTLCILAFGLLAAALLPRSAACIAMVAYALLPGSVYEISGGGVTRSLGVLFALLTLHRIVLLCRDQGALRHVAPAIALGSLCLLSHPEWSWFAAYSAAIIIAFRGRTRTTVRSGAIVAAGILVVTSPVWGTVIARDGLTPYLSTLGGSGQVWPWYIGLVDALRMYWIYPVVGHELDIALILAGIAVCAKRRDWPIPSWLGLIFVLSSRSELDKAVIPAALLIGLGLAAVIPKLRMWIGAFGTVAVLLGALFLQLGSAEAFEMTALQTAAVPAPVRSEFAWIRHHTDRHARFLLITSATWALDSVAEWFPALTGRVSVTTVQGYEWLPKAFAARAHASDHLVKCSLEVRPLPCIQAWQRRYHGSASYLMVTPPLRHVEQPFGWESALRAELAADPHYRLVSRRGSTFLYAVRRS